MSEQMNRKEFIEICDKMGAEGEALRLLKEADAEITEGWVEWNGLVERHRLVCEVGVAQLDENGQLKKVLKEVERIALYPPRDTAILKVLEAVDKTKTPFDDGDQTA